MPPPKRKAAVVAAERPAHAYSMVVYAVAAVIALVAAEFRYVLIEQLGFGSNQGQIAALGVASFLILYIGLGLLLVVGRRLPVWKALVFGVATPVLCFVMGGVLLALMNSLARSTGGLSVRAYTPAVIAANLVIILGIAMLLGGAPRRQSWLSLAILAASALSFHIVFRLADRMIAPDALGGEATQLLRIVPPAVNDLIIAAFCLKLFALKPKRAHLPKGAVTEGASELVTAWPPRKQRTVSAPAQPSR